MPSISIENLRFFDKTGADISPVLTNNVWTASLTIPNISIGLHEVAHIFIGEDVIDSSKIINLNATTTLYSPIVTITSGTTKNLKPGMWIKGTNIPEGTLIQSIKNQTQIVIDAELGATGTGSTSLEMHPKRYELTYPRSSSSTIRARFAESSEIFYLFSVEYDASMPLVSKVESFSYELDNGSGDTTIFNHRELSSNDIRRNLIQINIAASAKIEGAYSSNVIIEEIDTDGTITQLGLFTLFFEAIGEDERFKSMLENFGKVIDADDYIAFRDTDIKEDRINYLELNEKRKEMLLAGNEIWPYLGSYKGLINALKFFGYGDLRLKEYWLNVSENSKNEGKMITMNVPLSLNYTDKEFNDYKKFIDGISPNQPSKTFRKTAKFALFYDINRDTGDFDEDGLPITEDVFEFTNEEILIKLFNLKNILKEKFLPLNARIIDITGEGVYYDNIGINTWNIPTPTIHVDVEKDLDFSATPIIGYLEDLTDTIVNNCDLKASTKLKDKQDIDVLDYAYCIIGEDTDSNGNYLVEKHPRYARKIGFKTTLTNLTNDYVWSELQMTWDEASEKTWENLIYQDYQTMRWIVRSVDRNIIIFDKKGEIGTLDSVEIVLPYLGFYDVTLELVDHFNFPHRQTKKNYIEVRPKEADIAIVFRTHDSYDTWEEIENTEDDLALADMHGTWLDITINEDTTWTEVGDLTWESVDWNTYANQGNLFDYYKEGEVNTISEEVGQVIGIQPSKHEVRIKGINNSLFFNNRQQNAFFFKDRTKADNLLLDIIANGAGSFESSKNFNNNSVHFVSNLKGWIAGDKGKFLSTIDGGETWQTEIIDTVNNLNFLHFTTEYNGWIVGDYGTVYEYKNNTENQKLILKRTLPTNNNLYTVHFINETTGYIGGNGVIFKTTDNGLTWQDVTPTGLSGIVTSLYFPKLYLGIAVTNNGIIYKTINGGLTWSIVGTYSGEFKSVHFYDDLYGWASYSDGTNHKILKTVNGGDNWIESPTPILFNNIKFINRTIGFASGTIFSVGGNIQTGVVFKTINGGMGWMILFFSSENIVKSIYPIDTNTIYAVGLNGNILKTLNGGLGSQSWSLQTQNQLDVFPIGGEADVWITEAYNGIIFENEQASIVIRHTPLSLVWTDVNALKTTWPSGSLQYALDAKFIFFDTNNGRKQYSISSAKLTVTQEVEYTIDQYIYDNSNLTSGFVVQNYSSVIIDNVPRSESGGLRIRWRNTWTSASVPVIDNMMILLRLESKDLYCNVLDMQFENDETILVLDWSCDIVKKLDPDYFVALKPYDIKEANNKMGTINRTWESFCSDVTWDDMSDKTWNDFEFNGISYCSFTIKQVKRGGVIIVDDKHFFQFPPEEIKQLEGTLTLDDGFVEVGTYHFTAETESGSVYVYINDIKDLEIGMLVTGGGIQSDSFIVAIEDETPLHGKRFVMDKNANITGTVSVECSIVNVLNLEIGMQVNGDGIQPGSVITYLDGITPYYDNRFIMSLPATKSGKTLVSFSSTELTLQEAVDYLNASDIDGIKDFYYSVPLLDDGVTLADYILAKAKLPGVSGLHYFEFLFGVESDWEDDPSHSHSYPLGIMKEWTKSEADGGQPLGLNNPPLWNYLYNTYYEFGEWFPVPELLGEYSTDLQDMRALYVQALDGSFNWQDTNIKRWKAKINPGTTLFMNSFPSKIAGIREHKWKLYDSQNVMMAEINNEFLIWTFCNSGNYSVELEVSDIENNSYKVRRNGFIEVGKPKEINHYLPGLGWSPPSFPIDAPIPPSVVPTPPTDIVPKPIYERPSLVSVPTLKYYSTYIFVGSTFDNIDPRFSILCSWESKEIRNSALNAREFFVEYLGVDGSILTAKFDIDATTDTSEINTSGYYNALPNQSLEDYLNQESVGSPFKNISIWKFPNNYSKFEEFQSIRSNALDSYTLDPSKYVGYDIGSLNLYRIYFVPTTTSNV